MALIFDRLPRPGETVALLVKIVLYVLDADHSLCSAFGIAYRIPGNDEEDDIILPHGGECCPPLDDAVFS